MATVKKSAKSASKMMKRVAPTKKGSSMMQAPASMPMGGGPMMKKGGMVKKAQNGVLKAAFKIGTKLSKLAPKKPFVPMEQRSEKEQTAFMLKGAKENAENIKSNAANAEYFMKRNPPKKDKFGGNMKKYKSGGSFPDLNKDGKITKADVLKGRGVIAKSGTKMKKK